MAARGARAAGRKDASHWRAHDLAADDPETLARVTAFVQRLQQLGWTVGRNVQIDYRWATGDAKDFREYAAELVALAPDIILAVSTLGVAALLPQRVHRILAGR